MAREVETDYIGVPVGIMDQMAVAIANPGQALSLDTETLDFTLVDLPNDYHMAKIRKEECDRVKEAAGREDICQMSDAELSKLETLPENVFRRARHVVSEHRRVQAEPPMQVARWARD